MYPALQQEEEIMEHNPRLTSSEIGFLWNHYMANTMSHYMFAHFLENVDDKETKDVLIKSDELSCNIVQYIKQLFTANNIPIPIGFQNDDVNVKAPRLFSDTFYLMYIEMMIKLGAIFSGITLANSSRKDVRDFITESGIKTMRLANEITDIMQAKGTYLRPPQITLSETEYIKSEGFFTGFFGHKRPLSGIEIGQLFSTHQLNLIKIPLVIGFAQVAQTPEVKEYFIRGREYNIEQNKSVMKKLIDEDIPIALPSQFEVTTSTEKTFSDKLMMFHVAQLSSAKVRNFGDSMALSPRHDLGVLYGRFLLETGKYSEDGAEIMIKHNWLEQPPLVPNRKELVSTSK
jgi:hypothetical protein